MDFTPSDRSVEMQERLAAFMDEFVYPAEARYARSRATSLDPHHVPPVVEDFKVEARSRGLWHLFLPGVSGLSNVEYAPLAELMGRSPVLAAEACSCSAPDTEKVAVATLRAIDRGAAEIVVNPGPGRLLKALTDYFPGMGPVINRLSGADKLMAEVAEHREAARARKLAEEPGRAA